MRILQVTDTFVPSDFGGVKVVSYNISKALAKMGHEITVYTTDANVGRSRLCNIKHKTEMDGFIVKYFKNINNFIAFKYRLFIPLMVILALRKDIKNFDVIHIHNFRSFQHMFVYYYAKKNGIPYVLQAHGSVLPFSSKEWFKNLYDLLWGYQILKNASIVIALTDTEAEHYIKMGVSANKIVVVPNGIDISEFNNLPEKGIFKNRYCIKSDEKIILYIGRMNKTKGIDLLLLAFSELSKSLDNIKLVLIGPDDGFKSELLKNIRLFKLEKKVLFLGFVTNDEKYEAFIDSTVFVTPSFSGFPMTFLEACICGTPIITTTQGDKLSFIHNRVGIVVDYDKDKMKDAIFKIMTDEVLRLRFINESKRLVREEFSLNKVVKKVEQIYETVIH